MEIAEKSKKDQQMQPWSSKQEKFVPADLPFPKRLGAVQQKMGQTNQECIEKPPSGRNNGWQARLIRSQATRVSDGPRSDRRFRRYQVVILQEKIAGQMGAER